MKKILAYLLMFMATLFVATPAFAIFTYSYDGDKTIEVTPDGTTNNWDASTFFYGGLPIDHIVFYSTDGEANNKVSIYGSNRQVARVFPCVPDITGAGQVIYYNSTARWSPYIKGSECTFGTAANCRIQIILRTTP